MAQGLGQKLSRSNNRHHCTPSLKRMDRATLNRRFHFHTGLFVAILCQTRRCRKDTTIPLLWSNGLHNSMP